jgi:FlaA1/EpsC-like NDP-sugar epimerase/CheY-like chemotaxis protein
MVVMKQFWNHKRRLLVLLADVLLVVIAYVLANLIRFEGNIPALQLALMWTALPVLVSAQAAAFMGFGLYRGVWAYASISDLITILKAATAGSTGFLIALLLLGMQGHSRGVILIDWLTLIFLVGGARLSLRLYWSMVPKQLAGRKRVLVLGAGDAGEMIVREMLHNGRLRYNPVGFLDDDPKKNGLRIHGIPVLGRIEDVRRISMERGVEEVIIAMPSADRRSMRRIFDHCRQASLAMKTIPALGSILAGAAKVSDLRKVHLEDLLRREPARLDLSLIQAYLRGRRVLVTGAGGSIGSEICRQVAECDPAILIMLEKAENALFEIDTELADAFPRLVRLPRLVNITHAHKLREVFARYRPEVVFHAAAYKHVPLMEAHPDEAILNNVRGTRTLVEMAIAHGTRACVLISTDKAVNPANVMGASKRAVERYIQSLASDPGHGDTILCAVRFGNVLGSSGSVVPIFKRQIERGGPITITHPDMTRYFMTIQEAVQLVLRAATLARGGEIFVLDMGEPVKIADMARDMVRLSGLEPDLDIEFKITGLRPGEKLSEGLWYHTESVTPTVQDKLLVINGQEPRDYLTLLPQVFELEHRAMVGDKLGAIQALRRMVPEYQPSSPDLLVRPRVLVAEEDPASWETIQGVLRDAYDVIPVGDGAGAIVEARRTPPDLILLDLKVSGVNGASTCQALKADPRTKMTPIIVMSGVGTGAELVNATGMGADDYLSKPVNADELKARVQMLLRREKRNGSDILTRTSESKIAAEGGS